MQSAMNLRKGSTRTASVCTIGPPANTQKHKCSSDTCGPPQIPVPKCEMIPQRTAFGVSLSSTSSMSLGQKFATSAKQYLMSSSDCLVADVSSST
jgi:hypothetical protein